MQKIEVDALVFHLAFALIATAVILAPVDGVSLGVRILALVVGYNVALPSFAKWRNHAEWLRIWGFVLPISVLQIIPDWFLAEVVGSLAFGVPGLVEIGAVPMYMGLMWTIPLFLVIMVGERIERRVSGAGMAAATLTGLALFAGAEVVLPELEIWQPVGVELVAGIAVYILPAEGVLSALTFAVWSVTRTRSQGVKLLSAIAVMFAYLGAASTFYLLVEVV